MSNDYLETLLISNEEVVFTTHQHWLILAGRLITDLIAVALLAFVTTIEQLPDWTNMITYIAILVFVGSVLYKILVWWNHQYVVTNRRVLRVQGILNKSTTDTALEKVSDMNLQQSFLGRMLDYGTIKVLTAAEQGSDSFDNISHPIEFQTIVRETKEEIVNQPAGKANDAAADLSTLLNQLNTLHQNGLLTESEYTTKRAQLLDRV